MRSPSRYLHRLSLALLVALSACSGENPFAIRIRATQIVVTPDAPVLAAIGATVQLSAQFQDDVGNPALGVTVAWSSSDPTVVTVDPHGLARAVAANGTATIAASSGMLSGSVDVVVSQVPVSITATPNAVVVGRAENADVLATALDANGNVVDGEHFLWSVAPDGMVQMVVNSIGTVASLTGSAAGTATLTIRANSNDAVTLDVAITVTAGLAGTTVDESTGALLQVSNWLEGPNQ